MQATIRAELLAIGEIEATAGDTSEPLTRGILLVGATDDDVRAFAPLMCAGEVDLEVRRVPPPEQLELALEARAVATPFRGTAQGAAIERWREKSANINVREWCKSQRPTRHFGAVPDAAVALLEAFAAEPRADELEDTSANRRAIRELLEHSDRLTPLERAKSLAEYRPAIRQMMRLSKAPYPAAELAGVVFDLVDNVIALLADGEA